MAQRKAQATYYARNRAAVLKRSKELYWANPEKARARRRSYWKNKGFERWLRLYGITLEQYLAIQKRQRNRCAVCRGSKALVIDHCHSSKKVRGLLCNKCNLGLGMLNDDPRLLRKALRYLEKK